MQISGMFLSGKLMGTSSRSGRNGTTGEPWTLHFVGVEVDKVGGFPGETVVHSVQLNRDQVQSGVLETVAKLAGQKCIVPFYIRAFATRSGANYGLSLDQSADIRAVK